MKSVCEPLYLTTSFEKEPGTHNYSYSRIHNPNADDLIKKIKRLYNTSQCILFPSGMSAISNIFELYAASDKVFIVGHEVYSDTYRTLDYLMERYPGFKYHQVDVTNTEMILTHVIENKDNLALMFFESCTNPSGHIMDFKALNGIKKIVPNCKIVIDNSWLTPLSFNPLNLPWVDIVVESGSKYFGGGRCIFGFVVGNKKKLKELKTRTVVYGVRMSQYDCWQVSDSVDSLELRMNHLSKTTIRVAKFLEMHKNVCRVMYPMLESHPSFSNAKKYLKLGPGILMFHIPMEKKEAIELIWNKKKDIMYATSYGKPETMIDPYPCESISGLYDEVQEGVEGTWFRLAIGWKDKSGDIIRELDEILS